VPVQIGAVEKDGKLDEPQKVAALRALAIEAEERLADGWLLASGKLDAVEIWLTRAEGRPAAAQPAQPAQLPPGGASPQPTPPAQPTPEPGAAGGAAGDAAGAAGGTYPMGAPQQGSAAANAAK